MPEVRTDLVDDGVHQEAEGKLPRRRAVPRPQCAAHRGAACRHGERYGAAERVVYGRRNVPHNVAMYRATVCARKTPRTRTQHTNIA